MRFEGEAVVAPAAGKGVIQRAVNLLMHSSQRLRSRFASSLPMSPPRCTTAFRFWLQSLSHEPKNAVSSAIDLPPKTSRGKESLASLLFISVKIVS
jgi:hypothetical protein